MAEDTKNLNKNLKQLAEITEWFDNQEEIDVEEGLKKVKEAVVLIRASKQRLKEIENEFETIKRDIDTEESGNKGEIPDIESADNPEDVRVQDIPF